MKHNEFITRDAQVAIGQYLGSGGMTLVAQLCPMLKGENGNPTVTANIKIESTGVGIATMTVVGFLDIYYCVIIAWTFFYLFATFTALPGLPWATCGNCHSFSISCPLTFPYFLGFDLVLSIQCV